MKRGAMTNAWWTASGSPANACLLSAFPRVLAWRRKVQTVEQLRGALGLGAVATP